MSIQREGARVSRESPLAGAGKAAHARIGVTGSGGER
jgi:hypothetical protein